MNYSLTLLVVLWLLFGISHSLLADLRVKYTCYRTFGLTPTTYRVFYNLFAIVFLTTILYLQVVLESTRLFESAMFTRFLSFLFCLVGATFMIMCVLKYFKQLSGLFRESVSPRLETGGLHKYVRHPLYFGTILFIIGLFFYFPYLKNALAGFILVLYTIIGTFYEEKKLVRTFGEAYEKYQQQVPMIFPWPRQKLRKSDSA